MYFKGSSKCAGIFSGNVKKLGQQQQPKVSAEQKTAYMQQRTGNGAPMTATPRPSPKLHLMEVKCSMAVQREWQLDSRRAARSNQQVPNVRCAIFDDEIKLQNSATAKELLAKALSVILRSRNREKHEGNALRQPRYTLSSVSIPIPDDQVRNESDRIISQERDVSIEAPRLHTGLQKGRNNATVASGNQKAESTEVGFDQVGFKDESLNPQEIGPMTTKLCRYFQAQLGKMQSANKIDHGPSHEYQHHPRPAREYTHSKTRRSRRHIKRDIAEPNHPPKQMHRLAAGTIPIGCRHNYHALTKDVASQEQLQASGSVIPAKTHWKQSSKKGVQHKQYEYQTSNVYPTNVNKKPTTNVLLKTAVTLRAVGAAPDGGQLPTAMMRCKGSLKPVKLDTCAQFSVTGSSWCQFGTKLDIQPPADIVEGFGGGEREVLGLWRFEMVTQYNQTVVIDAIVVNDVTAHFLIGEDWMYDVGAKINFVTSELKYYDGETRIIIPFVGAGPHWQRQPQSGSCKVRLIRQSKISTQTRRTLDLPVAGPEGTERLFIPKVLGKSPGLLLTPTMPTVRNGVIRVPILNLMGSIRNLLKRTALGTWSPSEQDMDILWNSEELKPSRVIEWLSELSHHKSRDPTVGENELDIEDSLNSGERKMLMSLLRNYRGLLEKKSECPPMTTTGVQHHINTGSNPPIRCRQRRYAQSELTVVDEQVEKMLADQVIEECNDPWAFPVVLVKKKDGTIRFCLDYRSLNAVTVKDVYPLHRIDETLDHLRGTRYFTTLNLHSGYLQVGVAEAEKDKTAFQLARDFFDFGACRSG